MAQTFNPYAEWLGVQTASPQPNHYELLRLERFESNQDTILTAANLQMAKVRGVRPGEHVDLWRQVLDELSTAKRCLTDLAEKSQYDAALRAAELPASGPNSNNSPATAQTPNGAGYDGRPKRSPTMEVTNIGVSNPLPPGFGSPKVPAGPTGGSNQDSNQDGGRSGEAAPAGAWQPGMNLLPPSPRKSHDLAPGKASAPQSPLAAQGSATEVAAQASSVPDAPSASAPPGVSPSPPAQRPTLVFPGETVPTAAPERSNSPPPKLSAGGATPAPTSLPSGPMFPQAMPQQGAGFNAFPRPFPAMPMPGMTAPGTAPSAAMPPHALQQPPVPQQAMPHPFPGPFFPGAPIPPGGTPQFQQFPAAATGMPSSFPQSMAPSPYAAPPMSPGAMPGFFPRPGAMPGAANFPPRFAAPIPAPQQAAAMPPAELQQPSAAGAANFFDDVLSGPARGGSSPLDELGFGDSAAAAPSMPQRPAQPPADWQASGFPQPAAMPARPDGFEPASVPVNQAFDPSAADTMHRPRTSGRPKQNSQTLLIGGALGAVLLLAGGLIAAILLRQHDDKTVAANDPISTTSSDSTYPGQHPLATPGSGTPKLPGTNSANPKTTPPTGPKATEPNGNASMPKQPPTKAPAEKKPDTKIPVPPARLVLQPTPDASSTRPAQPTPAKPKPAAVDPAKAARLNHLLVDVRQKLAERNQDEANRLLADAKGLAVTPEQSDRVERLGTLVKYVGEFWGAVRDALAGLKATDEIDVGSTKVVVVDRDEQSLTIHMGSGNRHFNLKELPSGLAIALANRWLDPSKPANKVFIGAFYAVDPKLLGDDPEAAKRFWGEAAAAGVSDGTYLMPLLNPEPANAAMPGSDAGSPLPPAPSADALDRATRKVRDEFDDAIVSATTATKLDELIQRFFDAAESSDEPARRFALYVQARDVAAQAGRAKLTVEAIDHLAQNFQIDALDMKADTFSNNPPSTPEGGREVARAALTLADEAVAAKRLPVASRFAQLAVAAAQVSKGNDLIRRAMQKSKQLEEAGKKMASDPQ
ncbi:MAG TPA: hypothetical protein VHX65_12395 [Pirellulales bacterium]|nr:hypothetical protein [Pirellulales bacterium]